MIATYPRWVCLVIPKPTRGETSGLELHRKKCYSDDISGLYLIRGEVEFFDKCFSEFFRLKEGVTCDPKCKFASDSEVLFSKNCKKWCNTGCLKWKRPFVLCFEKNPE